MIELTLGERLRRRRNELGLSQRELGAKVGMSAAHVARIECGQRFPLKSIAALADLLEIPEFELLESVSNQKLNDHRRREEIEVAASEDRATALRLLGKTSFDFPKDMKRIPQLLFGLQVEYEDVLFRSLTLPEQVDDKQKKHWRIFAGLYIGKSLFKSTRNVIAVATERVKSGNLRPTSERTMTFHVLHEMGHFRLHSESIDRVSHDSGPDVPRFCSAGDSSPEEEEANSYAISFLVPRDEVRKWLGGKTTFNMRKYGKQMCEHFFVEERWLRWRLQRLRVYIS